MTGTNFSVIAERYERDALVQKSASERLLSLLKIGGSDRVLDLGCGAGNITRRLRELTCGRVAGCDPAPEMIRQAQSGGGTGIEYRRIEAEALDYQEEFDIIFCNSAFQWFSEPDLVLANCFRALKQDGRMGIQAPATTAYCPNFLEAIAAVARDDRTAGIFAGFRSPWLFFDTAEEYAAHFERAGFSIRFAALDEQTSEHPAEEVMRIFESGAAAGYLNPACYRAGFTKGYAATFREIVADSFRAQAGTVGKVVLRFNRIYLVGGKP